ncbi:NAD/FAD-utilizing enzyme [Shewanella sedimentimangrovi]|uniref:NAD/FAD-utilizing enzyme n=1 Tax=Shewanella sedimentimangrovi TaxID=2814293 RepID=A0ABX7R810_9GAMM|nr:NAD/FAD-utilizing enzyme [Shewanella sedimentimangrovi]QSX38900.1 NAD/FAD-utilizing enzyme [Shewanella sedimentimangrovi]
MVRHYYATADLDDLEQVEHELEANGITEPQIHVLSEQDGAVESHHLHEVEPVLKQDVVHSTEIGAFVGILVACAVLVIGYLMGLTEGPGGWVPLVFLAIVLLGFCTWEGGFIGIQVPNVNFKRFQGLLHRGRHVFFVDIEQEQEGLLSRVIMSHPRLHAVGTGEATPSWVVHSQDNFKRFMKFMP